MAGRGWHAKSKKAPHAGKEIAVEPIRRRADVKKMLGHLEKHCSKRDYALCCVGVSVGLRAWDLLALRWRDVMDDDGSIRIHLKVREHKTKKFKTVALNPRAKRALTALLPEPEKEDELPDVDPDAFVFASRQGQRKNGKRGMTVIRLNQLMKEWTAAIGLKGHYGTHTLRKTFAYHCIRKGQDITALMKLLNHSSPGVTLRYAGITQEDLDKVVLSLDW
jgi:integrase